MKSNNRRSFIQKLTTGVGAALSIPNLTNAVPSMTELRKTLIMKPIIQAIKPLGFVWETKDPFLFCVHHDDKFPKGNEVCGPATTLEGRNIGQDFVIKDGWRMYHGRTVPGFPSHPHKGFETITVVRKGIVDHADSMGAAGRYGHGDVQWMTAGKGMQHSEMFPLLNRDIENPMELFQIWLNLPAKGKKAKPYFLMMWSDTIPKPVFTDNEGYKTTVEVIAGNLLDSSAPTPPPESWALDPNHNVAIWNIHMQAGAIFEIPAAQLGTNRVLYYYEGKGLHIAGTDIPAYHAIHVESDQPIALENKSNQAAKILVLQGKPIGEPVVQHGPFVMNTIDEIHQAFAEFQATQFGGWPWPKSDQVHARNLGRFARHADGKEEHKG